MKKKNIFLLIVFIAVFVAAAAIISSPASLGELLIKKYSKLHIPEYAEIINPAQDGGAEILDFIRSRESADPMDQVDSSTMVYKAIGGCMLSASEGGTKFEAPEGETLMLRGGEPGRYRMQDISGNIYFLESLDSLQFIEESPCGLTETAEVPLDAAEYMVAYGDRILRYSPELAITDNTAFVVPPGTSVYSLDEGGAMFRVVLADGRCGYMNSQCLEPCSPQGYRSDLPIVDAGNTAYGYYEMMQDVSELLQKYPDNLQLVEIGESVMGKGIPVLLLGNPGASYKMLVQASIHAREYATTLILMKQLEALLDELAKGQYGALDDTALIVIPMSNPDGAMLSMTGDTLLDSRQKELVKVLGDNTLSWKSNINGVDLNRNFDANWDLVERGVTAPYSERFMGYAPDSEPETLLLKKYTDREDVVATVSYHTAGSVIYWWYYQSGELLRYSESLGQTASDLTGYDMVNRRGSYGSHGGLKDYGVTLGRPGITIEFGRGNSPLPQAEVQKALEDSKGLLFGLAEWVGENYY